MAVKSSGSISLTDLTAEFGGGNPISISQFYRGGGRVPSGAAANAGIPTSGQISMSQFYGSVKELQLTISGTEVNYNLKSSIEAAYGTLAGATVVRLTLSGGIGGTTTAVAALDIGQFPSGSVIFVDIVSTGQILGYGGAGGTSGAGGNGGDAIKADYPNQIVTINNSGTIYAGGGGGGNGGTGGVGGTGGQGYYNAVESRYNGSNRVVVDSWTDETGGSGSTTTGVWNGSSVGLGGTYTTGSYVGSESYSYTRYDMCRNTQVWGTYYYYYINRNYQQVTAGGAGGAASSGGNGGQGQGYGMAVASGSAGGQNNGLAGGTNAGTGGKSGVGGTGGSGGNWGSAGSSGATGGTGLTGAAGNYSAGSAGAAGGAGSAGGAAGRYLVKGAANVTLNNAGSVAGGLA